MTMTFDPAALIPLGKAVARIGLPFLPSILNDVVPFPLSLLTGPAVTAILAVLGVDPAAPDAPTQAAAKIDADPVAAKVALQPIEDQHAALATTAEEELQARLQDVQDARATEVQYVKASSPMQWGAPLVSVLAVIGFFIVAVFAMLGHADSPGGQWVVGAAIAGWTTVLSYWIGSSKGSADKTDALTAISSQPQMIQGPDSHVSVGVAPTRRAGR